MQSVFMVLHMDRNNEIQELRIFRKVEDAVEIMKAMKLLYPEDVKNISMTERIVE